jgi:hypothetical protein
LSGEWRETDGEEERCDNHRLAQVVKVVNTLCLVHSFLDFAIYLTR